MTIHPFFCRFPGGSATPPPPQTLFTLRLRLPLPRTSKAAVAAALIQSIRPSSSFLSSPPSVPAAPLCPTLLRSCSALRPPCSVLLRPWSLPRGETEEEELANEADRRKGVPGVDEGAEHDPSEHQVQLRALHQAQRGDGVRGVRQ